MQYTILQRGFFEYPEESRYALAISYAPEYVSKKAMAHGLFLTKPILDLYEKGKDGGAFLADDVTELNALLFAPMIMMLQMEKSEENMEKIKQVVWMSVDSVLKKKE